MCSTMSVKCRCPCHTSLCAAQAKCISAATSSAATAIHMLLYADRIRFSFHYLPATGRIGFDVQLAKTVADATASSQILAQLLTRTSLKETNQIFKNVLQLPRHFCLSKGVH